MSAALVEASTVPTTSRGTPSTADHSSTGKFFQADAWKNFPVVASRSAAPRPAAPSGISQHRRHLPGDSARALDDVGVAVPEHPLSGDDSRVVPPVVAEPGGLRMGPPTVQLDVDAV